MEVLRFSYTDTTTNRRVRFKTSRVKLIVRIMALVSIFKTISFVTIVVQCLDADLSVYILFGRQVL